MEYFRELSMEASWLTQIQAGHPEGMLLMMSEKNMSLIVLTYVFMCIYSCPYMSEWAVVNKSLQITSDENRMKFMDRDCFFIEWAWKSGEDEYRGKE